MPTEQHTNGFGEYKNMILDRLDETRDSLKDIYVKMNEIKLEVNTLKTRASVWGSVTGLAAGIFGTGLIEIILFLLR